MHVALAHAGPAAKVDRIAQTFAAIGEVPDAAVMVAILMTYRAGQIAFEAHAHIAGVVEFLLAQQHVGREGLRCNRADRGDRGLIEVTLRQSIGQVKDGNGTIRQILVWFSGSAS